MMPTKELQEVYNNAQEVTSLGSTDRLLAKDADGNPKSISSENLKDKIQFTSTAGKWHTLLALGLGGRASVGSMAITTSPVNQECFLLKWSIMRTGSITPKVFEIFNPLTSFGVTIMPKLRVLAPTSSGFPAYIEVFITEPKTVDVCLGACVNVHFNYGINTGIPSGYNVLEFDLSIFGGGGNLFVSNQLRNLAERRVA